MLSFGFRIFCWYRGFCHRTGSDLLLFLFKYLKMNFKYLKMNFKYLKMNYKYYKIPIFVHIGLPY